VAATLEIIAAHLCSADSKKLHHVVLTGGGIGSSITNQLVQVARKVPQQTWANTHFWWGDERFVDSDSIDRNDFEFQTNLGEFYIGANVHRILAANQVNSVAEAAADYTSALVDWGTDGLPPRFSLVLLGVGPDGHVASLFPGKPELDSPLIAIPIIDSPKPPLKRVTMGLRTLNNSELTLLLLAGQSKRKAMTAILDPVGSVDVTPARGIKAAKLYAITDLLVSV
jgi:6-phosphogluconolactonase